MTAINDFAVMHSDSMMTVIVVDAVGYLMTNGISTVALLDLSAFVGVQLLLRREPIQMNSTN